MQESLGRCHQGSQSEADLFASTHLLKTQRPSRVRSHKAKTLAGLQARSEFTKRICTKRNYGVICGTTGPVA